MRLNFEAAEPVQLVYRLTGPSGAPSTGRVASYPDALTEREVEVLRLIASGRSNREIADDRVISVRTVERHIANIYTKCGVRTKAQATDYAHRHGLT